MKNWIITGTFLVFIFMLSILNVLTPDRELSEMENRPLAQRPTLTVDTLLSGEFMSEFETYVTDQFLMKDWWVGLKAEVEAFLQKGENNGVYLGKEGYLLEAFTSVSDQFEKNLTYLNLFHEKLPDLPTTALLVPTAVEVYPDLLPLFAPTIDQAALLNQASETLTFGMVHPLEIFLSHANESLFYKTDHHWTTLGAFYAYQTLMAEWGLTPYLDYTTEVISSDFYGTYYSKVHLNHLVPDQITIYHPKEKDPSLTTTFGQTVLEGVYDLSYLTKKDKYSLFLGGNQPLTILRSGASNGRKLVIFKDSYAHCFAPFLAKHFEEIHLIDLRYFNQNPYDYVVQESFDQALFLYNLSTFAEESSLIRLKAFQPTN